MSILNKNLLQALTDIYFTLKDLDDHCQFINDDANEIVSSHTFDRITGSRSRSTSVETCIINNVESAEVTKNTNLTEKQEGDNVKFEEKEISNVISMKSKFSRGAIAGIFSSVIEFYLRMVKYFCKND